MIESKSHFARRINKPMSYVSHNVRRGNIVLDERGFVQVEQSIERLNKMRRGRPKVGFWNKKVCVFVPRKYLSKLQQEKQNDK